MFSDTGWLNALSLQTLLIELQPPIRKLCLDQCFNLTWHALINIIDERARNPNLAKLEELTITYFRAIDDVYANVLLDAFPNLTFLDLSYTAITGCTIRTIAELRTSDSAKGPRIDRLIVRGCEGISSDAVAYGREKGLDVIF
jgi:F-box/TPR repeat protein Pof3